eukprot:Lankesteria_metandrocarpae@DN4295_c0_g1_i1.p1
MAASDRSERDHLVYKAKLAEQAERYDEMTEYMRSVAEMGKDLNIEERNLLSVSFKNAVGSRRASWRIVSSVEQKQRSKSNQVNVQVAAEYRSQIEEELKKICDAILNLLDDYLVNSTPATESRVFYHKMRGDYYRYIAEFTAEKKRDEPKQKALQAYDLATNLAKEELKSTHPIRLGLALNFSVFYYEILSEPRAACTMAQEAFDEAIAELDSVEEESYRDSTLIMQLLRDNLTLWTAERETPVDVPTTAAATAAPTAGGAAPVPAAAAAAEKVAAGAE